MKQADMLRIAEQGNSAAEAARMAAARLKEEGRQAKVAAAVAAKAKHLAYLALALTRHAKITDPDTGLLVVPPLPKSVDPRKYGLTGEFPWPEGFIMGTLSDANERKAAVEALIADLILTAELARNAASATRTEVDTYKTQVSWTQSLLSSERQEREIDAMAGHPVQATPPAHVRLAPPPSDEDYRRVRG